MNYPKKLVRLFFYIGLLAWIYVCSRQIALNIKWFDKCFIKSAFAMASTTQTDLDYLSKYLQIKYELIENTEVVINNYKRKIYYAEIVLHNRGEKDIAFTPWSVYFYEHGEIELLKNDFFELQFVGGDLYSLLTTSCFTSLASHETITVRYTARGYLVARTDIAPNWYVAAKGLEPRILNSTAGESLDFIVPFDTPQKWKRGSNDVYNPYTPEERFEMNDVNDLHAAPLIVLPTPLHTTASRFTTMSFEPETWVIVLESNSLIREANYMKDHYKGKLEIVEHQHGPKKNFISLSIGDVPDTVNEQVSNIDEAYSLSMDLDVPSIHIKAITPTGVFYGIQSIISILSTKKMPKKLEILDGPRYTYRGFMLDVCRNFYPKEEIFLLIDVMSSYKLNKLHLHLSEDEGWRLQIHDLPELTELGACRGHTYDESDCLYSTLGSGPEHSGLGNGFYTVTDYQDILHYATQRHIQVIPELDMPGHSRAAIISMNARYNHFMKENQPIKAREFHLIDPLINADNSVLSVQKFDDNSLNPCLDSTYRFVEFVIDALIDLHKHIQPLESFHFGGDEVPLGVWEASLSCRQYLKENHPELQESQQIPRHAVLKKLFFTKLATIAGKKGLTLHGWEDAFYEDELTTGSQEARDRQPIDKSHLVTDNKDIVSNVWMSTWERGYAHRPLQLANHGYKVVLSSATHLYFDHPHEPDPNDRGLYWATRMVPLAKVYGFMPARYLDNIDATNIGRTLTKEQACKENLVKCVKLEKPENIIGVQGQLWSETVRTPSQLHQMIYPRLLALAERAWNHAAWERELDRNIMLVQRQESWQDYINTLAYKELPRLENAGVNYWMPPPGAKISDGVLHVNSIYPGVQIVFSTDEGKNWSDLKESHRASLRGKVWLAANRYHRSSQRSHHIIMDII